MQYNKTRIPLLFNLMMCLCLIFLIFITGCASRGTQLDKYPMEHIDRPYTLPKGVHTWEIATLSYIPIKSSQSNSSLVHPLIWRSALSDNVSLLFTPLPLGLSYQILHNDTHRLGTTVVYLFYSSSASISYQYRLGNNWAIRTGFDYFNRSDLDGNDEEKGTSVILGLLYQAGSRLSLEPWVSKARIIEFQNRYIFSNYGTDVEVTRYPYESITYGLSALYTIGRQWDVTMNLSQNYIVEYDRKSSLHLSLRLIHYWD